MTQEITTRASGELVNYDEFPKLFQFCKQLAGSRLLPDAYHGKPEDVFVVLNYGRELGLKPMVALNQIYVVKGRPMLSGSAMAGMILQSGLGGFEIVEKNERGCKIFFWRDLPGGKQTKLTETFTIEDAKRAGLTSNQTWSKYPEQMCYNRCLSKGARVLFSDLLGGMYVEGEIPGGDEPPVVQPPVVQQEVKAFEEEVLETPVEAPVVEDAQIVEPPKEEPKPKQKKRIKAKKDPEPEPEQEAEAEKQEEEPKANPLAIELADRCRSATSVKELQQVMRSFDLDHGIKVGADPELKAIVADFKHALDNNTQPTVGADGILRDANGRRLF